MTGAGDRCPTEREGARREKVPGAVLVGPDTALAAGIFAGHLVVINEMEGACVLILDTHRLLAFLCHRAQG